MCLYVNFLSCSTEMLYDTSKKILLNKSWNENGNWIEKLNGTVRQKNSKRNRVRMNDCEKKKHTKRKQRMQKHLQRQQQENVHKIRKQKKELAKCITCDVFSPFPIQFQLTHVQFHSLLFSTHMLEKYAVTFERALKYWAYKITRCKMNFYYRYFGIHFSQFVPLPSHSHESQCIGAL